MYPWHDRQSVDNQSCQAAACTVHTPAIRNSESRHAILRPSSH